MKRIKTAIVVPTIREKCIQKWFCEWAAEFRNTEVIVIEDNPTKTFEIDNCGIQYSHHSWEDIDKELGKMSWIISRRSDCIRSFGLFKAWQKGFDMVVTLDDDCYPDDKNFISKHAECLFRQNYPIDWFQHSQTVKVRGVPHQLNYTKSVANMGLWSHVPDLDAITQLANSNLRIEKKNFSFFSPLGYFSPISGMNLAFKREVVPAAYFLLMGQGYEYDRFGDIWMGIFLKKICDHLRVYITGGDPYIRHERASNSARNLEKEKSGYKINEKLWLAIKEITLKGNNFRDCYLSLASQLPIYSDYWQKLREAMIAWASLFSSC